MKLLFYINRYVYVYVKSYIDNKHIYIYIYFSHPPIYIHRRFR